MPLSVEGDTGVNLEDTSQHSDLDTETFRWLMEAWATHPMLRSLALLPILRLVDLLSDAADRSVQLD